MKTKKNVLYIVLKENDFRNIRNLNVDCFSLCSILENKSDARIIYPDPKKTFKKSIEQVLQNEIIFQDLISIVIFMLEISNIIY